MKMLAGLIALTAACGGATAEGPTTTTGGGSAAKPGAPGDIAFEVPGIDLKGLQFDPEALGVPGMPLVDAKRATTLEKQKKIFETEKDPVQKEAQAAIYATMLYRKSKDAKGDDKKAMLTDARAALRDAAEKSGDKADVITLRLLGSYELLLEDYAAAEKAWGTLVANAPKDKDALFNRAWWAYSLLREYKNADALAAVKDQALAEKQPELAYVTAWAKWRTGDNAGAWQAILTAAKGWGTNANKEIVDHDVLLFAGRAAGSLAETMTALTPLYGKTKDLQYALLYHLQESYQYAGRWQDGVAAIDKAIELEGDKVPANDLPTLRFTQADYTVRLDDPVTAAKLAKQAIDALPACGTKCKDQDKENLVEGVYYTGRLFHVLYATAHDDRYYQPAEDLYGASVSLITSNQALHTEGVAAQANLAATFKNMKATSGTHDKAAIGALLSRRSQEVQACYEQALSANAKLAGSLTLMLEADQTGAVKGVMTEPKAGLAEMALVAGCAAEHAKHWALPKRINGTGTPSTTRIKLSYTLNPAPKKS